MLGRRSLNEILGSFPLIPILLAFAIPAAFRAVPEILAGPYPLGFDTVTWYAPLMWDAKTNGLGSAVGSIIASQQAPLFNVFISALASIVPADPFLILKSVGPVFLGMFSVSVYILVRSLSNVRSDTALFVAVFVSLYFVTLRISWDLFRNLLGYAFFLLAMNQLLLPKERRSDLLLVVSVVLTYLTHELVLVLLLGVLAGLSLKTWLRTKRVRVLNLVLIALGVLALSFYAHLLVPPGSATVLGNVPVAALGFGVNYLAGGGFFGYESLGQLYLNVISLAAIVILPVLFFLLGTRHTRGPIGVWAAILLGAGLSPLLLPIFAAPLWHRWILMVAVPFAILAGINIARRARRQLAAIAATFLVVAGAYAFLPAETAFPLFISPYTTRYIQSSMLQNTGPLRDSPATVDALKWLGENAQNDSVLLAHYVFTGWALIYMNELPVQTYFNSARLSESLAGLSGDAYLIWWVEDIGWYPTEFVPPEFSLVHREDRIGIFFLS